MDHSIASRTLFSETIRSLYRIYGYEEVMKEVLFVHHLYYPSQSAPVPALPVPAVPAVPALPVPALPVPVPVVSAPVPAVPVPAPVPAVPALPVPALPVPVVSEPVMKENQKNEIVDDQKIVEISHIKHNRATPADNDRCIAILNNKGRCAIRRIKSDTMCHRHKVAREEEQEEQEQEQVESSDS